MPEEQTFSNHLGRSGVPSTWESMSRETLIENYTSQSRFSRGRRVPLDGGGWTVRKVEQIVGVSPEKKGGTAKKTSHRSPVEGAHVLLVFMNTQLPF